MPYWVWLIPLALLGFVGIVVFLWRPLRRFGRDVQVGRARESFHLQRERLEGHFITAAAATGKPRGLRWKDCSFESAMELARDRRSGQIVALLPVTIAFEAIEGGDMEGVAAVGNLRNASAVFFFERGQWHTVGKAVFNMNPDEALKHFEKQYERLNDSE